MKSVSTLNEAVSASFQTVKQIIDPIMVRKNGRLRTCGQTNKVAYDSAAGRFDARQMGKPPRWIIRVEGNLDKIDGLSVSAERCIGSFNFNQGADIVAVRLMMLHREQKSDEWTAFEEYEHRLLILGRPQFPEGSSSATVYCESTHSEEAQDEADKDAPEKDKLRKGETPPLAASLSIQRRGAPARNVEVEASLLLSPQQGDPNPSLSPAQQSNLETAITGLFDHWSLSVWSGGRDAAPVMAFSKAFDDLEPETLAKTLANVDSRLAKGVKSITAAITPDVYRRINRAIEDGFQHFVLVSRDADQSRAVGDLIIEKLPITMARLSLLRSTVSISHADTLQVMQQEGWILHVRCHQDALTVLEMVRIDYPLAWLTLPLTVDVDAALCESLRFAGIEPPSEPRQLREHVLSQTVKILMAEEGVIASPRLINQFFQMCLHHAPSASWTVPLDDQTRQLWTDALVVILPPMVSPLSVATKRSLLAQLGERIKLSKQEEHDLMTLV